MAVWAWPALGVAGEIAIVVSSLTDKGEQQRVVESLFREKYNVGQSATVRCVSKLAEAEQYRQRIQEPWRSNRAGILRDRMVATTGQVYDWIANMVRLARRIDDLPPGRDRPAGSRRDPKDIRELTGAHERGGQSPHPRADRADTWPPSSSWATT